MKLHDRSITTTSSILTGIISIIIAVSIPAAYFLLTYKYIGGAINAELVMSAQTVEGFVIRNPHSWQFEEIRLREMLERKIDLSSHDNKTIRDLRGNVIADIREPLKSPVVRFSEPIYDSGIEVARIEIERSIAPLYYRTAFIGVFSSLLGIIIFLTFYFFRLRTLKDNYIKLQESERQYKLITEKMTDIVWIADMNLRTLYISPSVRTVLGFNQEELPETVEKLMTPESWAIAMETLAGELALEEQGHGDPNRIVTLTLEYFHKDGSTRWMETIMSGLRNDQGVATGIHGVSRDITERKRVEESLQKSEEKYRQLAETTHDIIVTVDFDFKITYGNKSAANITGGLDLVGKNLLDFTSPDMHELQKAIMQKRREGFSDMLSFEWEINYPVGTIRTFDIKGSLLTDYGKPSGAMFVARDITDRKLAEENSRKSEEKFRKIFMTTPNAISLTRTSDGLVIDVNKGFEEIAGFKREQVIGKKSTKSFVDFWVNPSERDSMVAELNAGKDILHREFKFRRSDGSVRDGIYSARSINIDNEECLIFIMQDMTERKQAEEKFFKIFMTTPDCIGITRLKDGLIIDGNKGFEDIIGWELKEVIGTKSTESPMNFWVDLSARDFMVDQFKAGKDIMHREFEFRRKDGSVRTGIYSTRPINIDGEACLIFILQDITEQKRMERELVASQKMKLMGQITSGVAHEVRNPLHAIQAISEAMALDMDEKSDYNEYLMHIKTQVKRLSHLMNDLLDLGKPIQPSQFSRALLTEIAAAALRSWMEAHPRLSQQVKVEDNLQPDDFVLVDTNKIQQVIINLIENATQHSPKDEEILLTLGKSSDSYLIVKVVDKGEGLNPQDQPRVFEPFYTTRKSGTGLGLSICKHIIESHGGSIDIVNNKNAPGCTAQFIIPVYKGA
jgi:PAS domain S-box-containing protein